MRSPCGRWAITFNGEIYNFQELREELARQGRRFTSRTDTEVILALYERLGPAMLERLNGMFAIAILDAKTQELFLARDRMGIKPLYYHGGDGRFWYASEAKAFLCHPAFRRELAASRLDEYLLFRYVAGPETLLRGVRAVEPGTYLIVREGCVSATTYWRIPPSRPDGGTSARGLSQEFEALMRSSVRYQLISDVAVGCQLSGGVDSSLVAGWAADEHRGRFDAVSVVLPGSGLNEEPFIDAVSRRLGLTAHKVELDADYVMSHLERATWHYDFPLMQLGSLGIFRLSAEAKRHVTVLLSGEGSDEVFGGYPRYGAAAWLSRSGGALRRLLLRLRLPHLRAYPGLAQVLMGLTALPGGPPPETYYPRFSLARALATRQRIWEGLADNDPLERFLTYEQRTYLVELLMRQDRMSMAQGIENRVPFLDHRVVEFAKRLPTRLKVRRPCLPGPSHAARCTKWMVKRLAAERFGAQPVYRPKEGLRLPVQDWYRRGHFAAAMASSRRTLKRSGLFEMRAVDALFQDTQASGGALTQPAWTLTALGIWMNVFLERPLRPSACPADDASGILFPVGRS
jgi:asparagine synthase (glutamine-hydrolysing)